MTDETVLDAPVEATESMSFDTSGQDTSQAPIDESAVLFCSPVLDSIRTSD